VISSNPTNL